MSTQEQITDGYGLESQEQQLKSYVERHYGASCDYAIYADVHTGSELKERDSLQRLLTDIKRGTIKIVLVWKIDRLSRSMKHLTDIVERFTKQDVNLISFSEDMNFTGATGRFMLNMMGSIAELERGTIRSRTYAGKVASARNGNFIGNWSPYGFRKVPQPSGKGSCLIVEESQAKWVKMMYRWSVHDNLSDERIANKLNDLSVPYDTSTNNHHSRKKVRAEKNLHLTQIHPIRNPKNILYGLSEL